MILGRLRTKRRKDKVSVEYLIHVKQINPWHLSQSQKSTESLLLQWDGGNRSSGTFTSVALDEKIEFNESFRLPVTLIKESSRKGTSAENFQKNCLEFYLYEYRNMKLLGSATINLAEYGIIEEMITISAPFNVKKSSKSKTQPVLYVSIQSFDKDSSGSSPKGNLPQDAILDDDEVDEEDIAYFTDDDSASSQSLQTTASSLETTTHQNDKKTTEPLNDSKETVNAERDLPSRAALPNSDENTAAEPYKYPNNSEVQNKTESEKDSKSTVNMEPALPSRAAVGKSDENPVADQFYNPNKSELQNRTKSVRDSKDAAKMEPAVSSGAAFANSDKNPVAESFKHQNNNRTQNVTKSIKDSIEALNMEPVQSSGTVVATSNENSVAEPLKLENKSEVQNRAVSARDSTDTIHVELSPHSRAASSNVDKTVAEPFQLENKSKVLNRAKSARDSIDTKHMELSPRSGAASSNVDKTVAEPFKLENKSKVQNRAESARDSADTKHVELSPRSGVASSNVDKTVAEPLEDENNSSFPQSTVDMTSFRKIVERRKKAADGSAIVRKSAQQCKRDNGTGSRASRGASSFSCGELVMSSDSASSSESQIIQEDDTRAGRQMKDSQEKTTSSLAIDLPESKRKTELQKNGHEKTEVEVKKDRPEDEPLSELLHSIRKEVSSRTKSLTSSRHAHHGSFVPNDNLKHVKSRQLPFDSAKSNGSNGPSRNKELRVRAKENDIPEDTHNGSTSPRLTEIKGIKTDFSDTVEGLKSENEMLKEELREAAAVEVALYSVVAEHGNSANKVHAPARRLSRFYFHACKEGSRSKMASAARTSISGLILVSKACGNDVPRLTFWLSNSIVLRATVCQASGNLFSSVESDIINDKFSTRSHKSFHDKERNNSIECFEDCDDIHTFIAALEKVEAWIFSRIVESVWWQTLTPHMQSAAAKNSSSRKTYRKKHSFGDPDQVNFSIDLWKNAFKDACERLCPLRAGGLQCGCLPVMARLVMEQLVNRLDVAMFNAILRDSAEDMPTDPLSDPISDPKVLPVPAGKTSFGAGAQLKSSIGNWSRWLTDLFGIDDEPSEDNSDPGTNMIPVSGASFKPFYLLKSLSDLLMLPFDLLADGCTRQEVCPSFGALLIKRVLTNFVPDEFCPNEVPESVFEALDSEVLLEIGKEYITSVPCNASPIVYSPPKAASLKSIIGEVGTHSPSQAKGPSLLRKAYTSDDELDELDSPMKSIYIDCIRVDPSSPIPKSRSKGKEHPKTVRYQLLREVWDDEN